MTDDAHFEWHPIYTGRSFDSVRRELADTMRSDQRAYQSALDNAEREEFGAFATVREIEKRWSVYDLGWAEMDADILTDRIMAFEQAREDQQHMFSWDTWRGGTTTPVPVSTAGAGKTDWRENLTEEQRRKLASALAITVMVVIFVLFVIALSLLL